MLRRARFVKRLFVDLPRKGKLVYCLMRDPRVPASRKAVLGGALAVIATPFIDVPAIIPVIGELDVLALTLVSFKIFIAACPDDVVEEHEQLIVEQRSRFDEDLRNGEGVAVKLWARIRPQDGAEEPAVSPTYVELSPSESTETHPEHPGVSS